MKKYNFIIIGAGIVGLATALKILKNKPNVNLLIIEKENEIAKHQTGNNSGVIHSGIYYKPGSLKAKNCIDGYHQLINFCNEYGIKYEICGKLIVATSAKELETLEKLYQRGQANGLTQIKKISKEMIKEIEPYVNGISAIYVPYTGIIDFKEVCWKYLEVIFEHGGEIIFNEKVTDIKRKNGLVEVVTQNNTFVADTLVTCAGLYSDRLARLTHPNLNVRIIPFRGEYYKLGEKRRHLIKNLIYPVPDPSFPFLGVHFTRMINGEVEAGPNAVLAFKREGYRKTDFDIKDVYEIFSWKGFNKVMRKYWRVGFGEFYRSFSKRAFVKALQRLVPEIKEDDLEKGGAGVRAQACDSDGNLLDDFYILNDKNIIHVCNAPSPAATASLAIGDYISKIAINKTL